MAAEALKAPAGVDRDVIYGELVAEQRKATKKRAKEKAEEGRFFAKMWTGGAGALTAVGTGFLFGKFPNIATLDKNNKIPTDGVIAGISLIGAFMTEDEISDGLEGIAYGAGFPFLSRWGGRLAAGG